MVRVDSAAVGGGCIAVGLAHLLAPRIPIGIARYAYRTVLTADLEASERTERRVRAIGLAMLAVGTVVASADRSVSVLVNGT